MDGYGGGIELLMEFVIRNEEEIRLVLEEKRRTFQFLLTAMQVLFCSHSFGDKLSPCDIWKRL